MLTSILAGARPSCIHSPLKPRYEILVTSSSPLPKLSGKKSARRWTLPNLARLTGRSCTSDVCESSNSCSAGASSAASKSTSSLFWKTLSVLGALADCEVRIRIECSLTCPAKLEGSVVLVGLSLHPHPQESATLSTCVRVCIFVCKGVGGCAGFGRASG